MSDAERLARELLRPAELRIGKGGRTLVLRGQAYRMRYRQHAVLAGARVIANETEIWTGHLDLTVSEPALVELASQLGRTLTVVVIGRAAPRRQNPLIPEDFYSVAASGHTRFDYILLQRDGDGCLRQRPIAKARRWRWRCLTRRPRLWRFWIVNCERVFDRGKPWLGEVTIDFIRLGRGSRHHRPGWSPSPLLVLGLIHGRRPLCFGIDLNWYPSAGFSAGAPLIDVGFEAKSDNGSCWLYLVAHQGLLYSFQAGLHWTPNFWGLLDRLQSAGVSTLRKIVGRR